MVGLVHILKFLIIHIRPNISTKYEYANYKN